MTTITRENLIQILDENPALLQELRSLLLTRELLDMPQNLAEFAESVNRQFEAIDKQFEAINRRFEAIDRQFEAIDRRFDNLEADVEQLKVDVGYLKGKSLETEMPGRALSRLEYRFNISRPRLVRASTHYQPAHDFTDAVDAVYEASKVGDLSENQHRRILDTDMIVQGRGADTGKDTYVAVESSFTIGDSDIVRANRTATALRIVFPDADVWAAVYCAAISDENSQRAIDDGVEVISNARL